MAAIWSAAALLPLFSETRTTLHSEAHQLGYCEESLHAPNQSLPRLPRLRAWLSPVDTPRSADLIFVLAGRVYRKEYALELFRQGLAPTNLVQRKPLRNPPVLKNGLAGSAGSPETGAGSCRLRSATTSRSLRGKKCERNTCCHADLARSRRSRRLPDGSSETLIFAPSSSSAATRICAGFACVAARFLDPKLKLAFLAAPFTPPEKTLPSPRRKRICWSSSSLRFIGFC